MHRRLSASAAIAALLTLVSGCSGSSAATSAAAPKPATVSAAASASPSPDTTTYLQQLRLDGADSNPRTRFVDFTPQKSPDEKLLAAGQEACTDLGVGGKQPANVVVTLITEGWTVWEGVQIVQAATEGRSFCPEYGQEVADWVVKIQDK